VNKFTAMEKKRHQFPRGHAYMRFRNNGYTVHVDFLDRNVSWLDEIVKTAIAKEAEECKKAQALAELRRRQ